MLMPSSFLLLLLSSCCLPPFFFLRDYSHIKGKLYGPRNLGLDSKGMTRT